MALFTSISPFALRRVRGPGVRAVHIVGALALAVVCVNTRSAFAQRWHHRHRGSQSAGPTSPAARPTAPATAATGPTTTATAPTTAATSSPGAAAPANGATAPSTAVTPAVAQTDGAATPAGGAGANGAAARDEGRERFERGLTLANLRDYAGALAEFERSYEISRRPSVLYNIGSMYQALHRYPDAARAIERYLREATSISAQRRAEVERGLAQLRSLVAFVVFDELPAGATIAIDGEPVVEMPANRSIAVGPGPHAIEVRVPGRESARARVTVASGESRRVPLDWTAARASANAANGPGQGAGPATNHATARVAGRGLPPAAFIVATGVTGALGVMAIVFGVRVQQALAEFERLTQDDPRAAPLAARGATETAVANVMWISAAVTGTAAVVLATQTRFGAERATPRVTPVAAVGGAGLGVAGTF